MSQKSISIETTIEKSKISHPKQGQLGTISKKLQNDKCEWYQKHIIKSKLIFLQAQSAGDVEYTNSITAKG